MGGDAGRMKTGLAISLAVSVALNIVLGYYLWDFYVFFRSMLSVG